MSKTSLKLGLNKILRTFFLIMEKLKESDLEKEKGIHMLLFATKNQMMQPKQSKTFITKLLMEKHYLSTIMR
jgi:3-hydroxy-3-methylglutaryl CoA synthase